MKKPSFFACYLESKKAVAVATGLKVKTGLKAGGEGITSQTVPVRPPHLLKGV